MNKKILILNGPNLNLLNREDIYMNFSISDLESLCIQKEKDYHCSITLFQSNHEGEIIDQIHQSRNNYDGIIINAGAYTHTSIAIMDALKASKVKNIIEVHITNIYQRENFRHKSYISLIANSVICGMGIDGYLYGVDYILKQS